MTKTTKDKPIPVALRMLADWIEQGKVIESRMACEGWRIDSPPERSAEVGAIYLHTNREYRAKPDKPRFCIRSLSTEATVVERAIELTPEVIEACKAAGIEVE